MHLWVFLIPSVTCSVLVLGGKGSSAAWKRVTLCAWRPAEIPVAWWKSGAEWMQSPVLKYTTGYWTWEGQAVVLSLTLWKTSCQPTIFPFGMWKMGVLSIWQLDPTHKEVCCFPGVQVKDIKKKCMVSTGMAHWLLSSTGVPHRQQQGPNKKTEVTELMWSIWRC